MIQKRFQISLSLSWFLIFRHQSFTFFNFDLSGFNYPVSVLATQMAVGLLIPVGAAVYPIINGTRITVREAISEYGLGKGQFGTGLIDGILQRIRGLSRPLMISLRNTFRRKGRVALTLATLVLSGLMFMIVMSVGNSMSNTIEVLLEDFGFDVLTVFDRAHRSTRLLEVTEAIPGVAFAEVWDVRLGAVELDDGEQHAAYAGQRSYRRDRGANRLDEFLPAVHGARCARHVAAVQGSAVERREGQCLNWR